MLTIYHSFLDIEYQTMNRAKLLNSWLTELRGDGTEPLNEQI